MRLRMQCVCAYGRERSSIYRQSAACSVYCCSSVSVFFLGLSLSLFDYIRMFLFWTCDREYEARDTVDMPSTPRFKNRIIKSLVSLFFFSLLTLMRWTEWTFPVNIEIVKKIEQFTKQHTKKMDQILNIKLNGIFFTTRTSFELHGLLLSTRPNICRICWIYRSKRTGSKVTNR